MTSTNEEKVISLDIPDEMHEAIDALAEFFGMTYPEAFRHALFVGIDSGFAAVDRIPQPAPRAHNMRVVQ